MVSTTISRIAHGGATGLQSAKPTSEVSGPHFEVPSQAHYPLKPLAVTVTKLVERDQEQKDRDSLNSEAKWNAV